MPGAGRIVKAHWLCDERSGRSLAPRGDRFGCVGL